MMLDTNNKIDILSLSPSELNDFIVNIGEKSFRAKQIFTWLHKGAQFDEMSNIPLSLREKLKEITINKLPTIKEKYVSKIDGTIKYLLELYDGECIESVFMKYEHGNTVCVSSQAGCRMGCKFCASTLNGKVRDLAPSEIAGQIITIEKDVCERVDGIVLMGIGEPLDNYDNVIKFLKLISCPEGKNIGLRHISLSTCGLAEKIKVLANEDLPITLSISLHAADNETRNNIMPVNKKYPIEVLLEACRYYFEHTSRRISFEYTLIANKNDTTNDALKLAKLLNKEMPYPCHVNLILLNEVKETGLSNSGRKNAELFMNTLIKNGINATIRRKLGSDINASCGQLRYNNTKKQ